MSLEIEQIRQIYEKTIIEIKNPPTLPALKIEFYPYVGIRNRIFMENGVILVRISDVLRNAPLEFHQALAEILLRKVYRKKIPKDISQVFNDFFKKPEIQEKVVENRKSRGRKVLSGSQGKYFDLEEFFTVLNEMYFENLIPQPTLTWSSKETYRMLGRYDSAHHTITISKSLDDVKVPPFVIEYVVYHEMLHIKHPTIHKNGRRYSHTPAFRRDEREFSDFNEAEEWIEKNWGELSSGKRKKEKGKKSFLRRLLDF